MGDDGRVNVGVWGSGVGAKDRGVKVLAKMTR